MSSLASSDRFVRDRERTGKQRHLRNSLRPHRLIYFWDGAFLETSREKTTRARLRVEENRRSPAPWAEPRRAGTHPKKPQPATHSFWSMIGGCSFPDMVLAPSLRDLGVVEALSLLALFSHSLPLRSLGARRGWGRDRERSNSPRSTWGRRVTGCLGVTRRARGNAWRYEKRSGVRVFSLKSSGNTLFWVGGRRCTLF